jgi:uncharacterized protein HemX
MSGGATAAWIAAGAAAAGTIASVDQAQRAQHNQRLQAEQQQQQMVEAQRLQDEQLRAQTSMNNANLAQAAGAAAESKALMEKQLKAADESMNKASQKRPNTSRIVDEASQAGRAGSSGTMLTGSQGVDPGSLQLGRSTLLGA